MPLRKKHDEKALKRALIRGDVQRIKGFLKDGWSPKTPVDVVAGTTALMLAITHGQPKAFFLLLASAADLDILDSEGHNALFYAGFHDRPQMLKELLRRGSKLTPDVLSGPVYHGRSDLVRLLLEQGANPNSFIIDPRPRKTNQETLLGYAIGRAGISGYPEKIAHLLIDAGADVNKASPWTRASVRNGRMVADVLPTAPIRIAGARGLRSLIEKLWANGAKGTLRDAVADWTLERAIHHNAPEIVSLLIEAGHDVNAPGPETGKPPLVFAKEKRLPKLVHLLASAGARL